MDKQTGANEFLFDVVNLSPLFNKKERYCNSLTQLNKIDVDNVFVNGCG